MIKNQHGVPILVDDETGEVLATAFFTTPYNTNHDELTRQGGLVTTDKSKTDQSFKDDADINVIMDRIKKGATYDLALPEHFGVDERIDLLEARTRIADSNATFYNLAPSIRDEFQNNPARWEDQVRKDLMAGNVENLNRMGIKISKKPPAEPPAATPAPAATVEAGVAPATPVTPPKSPPGGD